MEAWIRVVIRCRAMGLMVLLVVAAALLHVSEAQSCGPAACPRTNTYYLKHYDELGCMPTYDKATCCPTVYNCSSIMNRPANKCRYMQMDYSIGQPLTAKTSLPCKSCSCANTTMGMGFQCVNQRCPKVRLPTNCVELYEFNSCCAIDVKCKTNITAPQSQFTCKLGNQTYFEGETIPSNHPCKSCLCQKGFDGTLNGPWCRNNSCGLELEFHSTFNRGCAPVYYKDVSACCPLRWRCPSTKDYIISPTPTTTASTTTKPMSTTMGPMTTTAPAKPPSTMMPMTMTTMMPMTMTTMMPMNMTTTTKPTSSVATTTMAPMTTTKPANTTRSDQRRRRDAPPMTTAAPTTTKAPATTVATATTTKAPATTIAAVTLPANATSSTMMCTFGSLRLKINDKLSSTSNKCIECTCTVPPYVTCLLEPRCSPW